MRTQTSPGTAISQAASANLRRIKTVLMSETADRAKETADLAVEARSLDLAFSPRLGEIDRRALRVDVEQVLPLEEATKALRHTTPAWRWARSPSRPTTTQPPRPPSSSCPTPS